MAVSVTSPFGGGEFIAAAIPPPTEMEAYKRVLTDIVAGDATNFARQDYVKDAWRIVDFILAAKTPIHSCEQDAWVSKEKAVVAPGV